ncbi:MAG TPA: arylsulfatase [Mycobacteriales bacterium]|nr:arylsulfatase [Mycobacteriales bacterium]
MTQPDIVLILADDLGFADLGCYGGRIRTPHLDALAANGIRMSQFYTTARCSPSRASLLTGLHPHQTGIGVLTHDDGPAGYSGSLNDRCVTMAEVLQSAGYTTAARGKWHVTGRLSEPNDGWPTRRGFDSYFGILAGAGSYFDPVTLTRDEEPAEADEDFYLTTRIGDQAAAFVRQQPADRPFFLYLPFTAPHWPLHAPADAIDRYRGLFDDGWDSIRDEQYQRQIELGIIHKEWSLSPRDADIVAWDEVTQPGWQARRMEVYAAQVELMDAAIGRVVAAVRERGRLDDTLIMFLSDNGGCAEEFRPAWVDELTSRPYNVPARTRSGGRVRRGNDPSIWPGGPETFSSYGKPWANVSNTPFQEYKHWVHEGGIASPFIVHWPNGHLAPGISHQPHQLPDVMATVVDITGSAYPEGPFTTAQGFHRDVHPPEGISMLAAWRGGSTSDRALFFEHEGNCAIRQGRWKLVRKYRQDWELYDLSTDRTELTDLAASWPGRVEQMAAAWQEWAERCGVKPREQVLAASGVRRVPGPEFRSSNPRSAQAEAVQRRGQ